MSRTRQDFCRKLLDVDNFCHEALEPERLADRFVRYFRVSSRPTLEELIGLMNRAGFGEVSGRHLDVKGIHYSAPGGGYDIHYRQDLWDGAQGHTVLHEAYEIIHETLCDMESDSPPEREVCHQADRFAAAVLMQPTEFVPFAEESGLDVLALQREFGCSYTSVALRLTEVVCTPPFMVVLYERKENGDPANWADPPELRATVVRRTRGFGVTHSMLICGYRGAVPRRGRQPLLGSLAERVVASGRPQYEEDFGHAVIATPVFWKGRLAKVAVVAVLDCDRDVLTSRMYHTGPSDSLGGLAAAGPW